MNLNRWLAVLLLAGCGGAANESHQPLRSSDATERPTQGELCATQYFADREVTTLALWVAGVGIVVGAVPGDGWQARCTPNESTMLTAAQQTPIRALTVLRDPQMTEMPSLEQFARQQTEHVVSQANANPDVRLTALDPRVLDANTYVTAVQGTFRGAPIMQINVHRLIPSAAGLLRYHLSETVADPDAIEAHLEAMTTAARVFNIAPPEAVGHGHVQ